MKFGAFIITYQRPSILKNTIECLLQQTCVPDVIMVIDNDPLESAKPITHSLHDRNVLYHAMLKNVGPAGAAAYGLQSLAEQGYDWMYWGDDDDPPQSLDTIERLLKTIASCNQAVVGGVGAVGAGWDWKKGQLERLSDQRLSGKIYVDAIGGGNHFIVSRQVVSSIGVPDARLFFGLEEPEYCLRARRAGYELLVDGDLMLEYRKRAGRLNLPQSKMMRPRDSYQAIWRRYYTTRNYIFMMNKTFGRPDLAKNEAIKAAVRSLTAWGYGTHYGARFNQLQIRGVLDGYRGRMGCTVLPSAKR